MTNYEFYREQIEEIKEANDKVGIKNNQPVMCADISCDKCLRKYKGECSDVKLLEWAMAEYEEPSKINLPDNITVDTPILVSLTGERWFKRHLARVDENRVLVWDGGKTSYTTALMAIWNYAKLPEEQKNDR